MPHEIWNKVTAEIKEWLQTEHSEIPRTVLSEYPKIEHPVTLEWLPTIHDWPTGHSYDALLEVVVRIESVSTQRLGRYGIDMCGIMHSLIVPASSAEAKTYKIGNVPTTIWENSEFTEAGKEYLWIVADTLVSEITERLKKEMEGVEKEL